MAKENTQETLATLTGLSQQRISQLQKQGIIARGENPIVSNRKIIAHLGKVAAGWQSQDGRVDRMHEGRCSTAGAARRSRSNSQNGGAISSRSSRSSP